MIDSFWRPLLVEGGLSVDTRVTEPDGPIVLRTIIQIDADVATFVDRARGGDDPALIVRHGDAIRRACAPLRNAIVWTDALATVSVVFAGLAAPWLAAVHAGLPYGPWVGSAVATLAVVLRRRLTKPLFFVVKKAAMAYVRYRLKSSGNA